jgi:hypothetical protein
MFLAMCHSGNLKLTYYRPADEVALRIIFVSGYEFQFQIEADRYGQVHPIARQFTRRRGKRLRAAQQRELRQRNRSLSSIKPASSAEISRRLEMATRCV